jgi:hypothetical protein
VCTCIGVRISLWLNISLLLIARAFAPPTFRLVSFSLFVSLLCVGLDSEM